MTRWSRQWVNDRKFKITFLKVHIVLFYDVFCENVKQVAIIRRKSKNWIFKEKKTNGVYRSYILTKKNSRTKAPILPIFNRVHPCVKPHRLKKFIKIGNHLHDLSSCQTSIINYGKKIIYGHSIKKATDVPNKGYGHLFSGERPWLNKGYKWHCIESRKNISLFY